MLVMSHMYFAQSPTLIIWNCEVRMVWCEYSDIFRFTVLLTVPRTSRTRNSLPHLAMKMTYVNYLTSVCMRKR